MVRFKGILVLSVEGRSGLSERCLVKGRSVKAFQCSVFEVLTQYAKSIPYGSTLSAEYWGNGSNLVDEALKSVLSFHTTMYSKK